MILFIDDAPQRMLSHIDFIRAQGLECEIVKSPKEVLDFMAAHIEHLELIVLDLVLPNDAWPDEEFAYQKEVGIKLCKELMSNYPNVPIIIYSVVKKRKLGVDWRGLGVRAYIEKSIVPGKLDIIPIRWLLLHSARVGS